MVFALMFFATHIASQVSGSLDPTHPFSQYLQQTWRAEDGLPQETINAVAQDQRGYVWLATQAGLVRFDGVNFRTFEVSSTPGMVSNQILSLYYDTSDRLWIGTDGYGLGTMKGGVFETIDPGRFQARTIRTIFEDRAGNVWIGTLGNGVFRFDGSAFTQYSAANGLSGDDVLSITQDSAGAIWVGTTTGLTKIAGKRIRRFSKRDGLAGDMVNAITRSQKAGIWLGFYDDSRVCSPDGDRFVCRSIGGTGVTGPTAALHEDAAGTLWIGTLGGGLFRVVRDHQDVFDVGAGLPHDRVRVVAPDREGSLWIGTEGGLTRLSEGKVTVFGKPEGLSNEVVISVAEDAAGRTIAGTDGGGLFIVGSEGTRKHPVSDRLPGNQIYALHPGRDGHLWVGLFSGGLCEVDDAALSCYGHKDGLHSDNVYALNLDSYGTVWAGTDRGLYYRGRSARRFRPLRQIGDALVTSIIEDGRRRLWIGTYDAGLFMVKNGVLYRFGEAQGLITSSILAVYESAGGDIWVGTREKGICKLQGTGFACRSRGLPATDILQILDDRSGNLWLGTLKGILRVNADDLMASVNTGPTYTLLTEADGLRSSETNGGVQQSAWKSRDGSLWFGTMRGLVMTDTDRIVATRPPAVLLESVTINDRPANVEGGVVRQSRGISNLRINFSTASFTAPENIRFRIRVRIGNEVEDWINLDDQRSAFYNRLGPGNYQFDIQSNSGGSEWSEPQTLLVLQVRPLFVQTLWFPILAGLLVILGIGGLYRLRIRTYRVRQLELRRIVEERTRQLSDREKQLSKLNRSLETLNASLEEEVQRQLDVLLTERSRYENELIEAKEKAEESARLKSSILTNMSHEIRTPLTAILGSAQVLAEEVPADQREFVDYIQENGIRLMDTLNSILEMSRLESLGLKVTPENLDFCDAVRTSVNLLGPLARKKNIELRTVTPSFPVFTVTDRSLLERIVNNLVGNAIKFTEDGEVLVYVEIDDAHIYMNVRDTGIGISTEFLPHIFDEFMQESTGLDRRFEGSGLGLSITNRMVGALGGYITVESEQGKGTTFRVALPLRTDSTYSETDTLVDESGSEKEAGM